MQACALAHVRSHMCECVYVYMCVLACVYLKSHIILVVCLLLYIFNWIERFLKPETGFVPKPKSQIAAHLPAARVVAHKP